MFRHGLQLDELNDCCHPRPMQNEKQTLRISADLHGASFHHHPEWAMNTVIFGKKRWILYDPKRWKKDEPVRRQRIALVTSEDDTLVSSSEWIQQLYSDPYRQNEIRMYGHDCIQHAGEMMFLPRDWLHMVVNIGDTVALTGGFTSVTMAHQLQGFDINP